MSDPCKLLLADPPWKFGDSLPGKTRGASKNYQTEHVGPLVKYPLPPIADDAILLLWRVAAMQEEAFAVVRAWGFTVKSEIVWEKRTRDGQDAPYHFGMGRYVRASHEVCLVAARGSGPSCVLNRSTRSIFQDAEEHGWPWPDFGYLSAARPLQHSAKPDSFYDLVERLFVGPRVELFARKPRPGWESYGLELEGRPASPPL